MGKTSELKVYPMITATTSQIYDGKGRTTTEWALSNFQAKTDTI